MAAMVAASSLKLLVRNTYFRQFPGFDSPHGAAESDSYSPWHWLAQRRSEPFDLFSTSQTLQLPTICVKPTRSNQTRF